MSFNKCPHFANVSSVCKLSLRGDLSGEKRQRTPGVTDAETDISRVTFRIILWSCIDVGSIDLVAVRIFTIDMDVLVFSEDNVLPRRNSEDPGISVSVHSDNGVNSTIDMARLSVGLKSLILDHKAPQRVTEEDDLIPLEDDGHGRWHLLISWARRGARGRISQAVRWRIILRPQYAVGVRKALLTGQYDSYLFTLVQGRCPLAFSLTSS